MINRIKAPYCVLNKKKEFSIAMSSLTLTNKINPIKKTIDLTIINIIN